MLSLAEAQRIVLTERLSDLALVRDEDAAAAQAAMRELEAQAAQARTDGSAVKESAARSLALLKQSTREAQADSARAFSRAEAAGKAVAAAVARAEAAEGEARRLAEALQLGDDEAGSAESGSGELSSLGSDATTDVEAAMANLEFQLAATTRELRECQANARAESRAEQEAGRFEREALVAEARLGAAAFEAGRAAWGAERQALGAAADVARAQLAAAEVAGQ
jgi:hypothetical protein